MKVTISNGKLWKNYLATLGIIGIFTGFLTIFITIKDEYKFETGIVFLFVLIVIFLYLLYRANNQNTVTLNINGLKVNIHYGDLFNADGLKLIPFNEYFDTLVDNDIVAENTLNGIFIKKCYPTIANLDNEITRALTGIASTRNDTRLKGKKDKYKIGTTIEVANQYIITALSRFDNQNRAVLTKGEYLLFLDNLWREINRIYAQRDINIPLLGSGITRIGNDLKPQDYLEQILNSIKLSNIDNAYNTKLNIVLHENVKEHINLFEIKNKF
jgi:hypothetical protein